MLTRGDDVVSASASQKSKTAPAAEVPTASACSVGTGRDTKIAPAVDVILTRGGDAVLSASSVGTAQKSKTAPAAEVLSACKLCWHCSERDDCPVAEVDPAVPRPGVTRSSRLGRADVTKIPAKPVLMSKCAANARC